MPGLSRRGAIAGCLLALAGSLATPALGPTTAAHAEQVVTPQEAAAFMDRLATDTLTVLRGGEASAEEKRTQVIALIEKAFDLPLISQFVLGRFWRGASEAQLAEYRDLFTQSITKSYARALVASGGTALEILNTKMVSGTDALVSTRLERTEGPPIAAGWRIRRIDGQIKVVDVLYEGVSLALTQRQEYASVIEREGLDGLIERLRKQSS
jgi:phospholipid transport system substrate-binding protein